jgi:hypothetical protein
MQEIHHGPQPPRAGFQVLKPDTDAVHSVIQRRPRQVRELFFTEVLPDRFHGIQFWPARRLWDQADIAGDGKRLSAIPARAIHLHDDAVVRQGAADMLQKELHHRRVGRWQHQGRHFPPGWGYRGIHGGGLAHHLPGGTWANSRPRPGAPRTSVMNLGCFQHFW